MKKIEMIWREVLEQGQTNANFEQKELALRLGFSTSTVFAAIKPLRQIGAVEVFGRGFQLVNFKKVLLFWATHRQLGQDIVYQTRVDLPILEIEGLIDNETVFGGYSAARRLLGGTPADYDKVYLYATQDTNIKKRFPWTAGMANVIVLKADSNLWDFGKITPVSQTYVDLWNLSDWFSQDYLKTLEEKFYGSFLQ